MKKERRIISGILIMALLFSGIPTVSAHIEIIDIGHNRAAQWNDIEGMCGYVDYQNVANHTIGGAILVFVDGEIVAGKILNMEIRYVAGFQCSPIKTLEFPITETEGGHTIVVHVLSMNSSSERTYEYYAKGIEEDVTEEVEREEVEDWLTCWGNEE